MVFDKYYNCNVVVAVLANSLDRCKILATEVVTCDDELHYQS